MSTVQNGTGMMGVVILVKHFLGWKENMNGKAIKTSVVLVEADKNKQQQLLKNKIADKAIQLIDNMVSHDAELVYTRRFLNLLTELKEAVTAYKLFMGD